MQTRKRPFKKDNKYIAKIEAQLVALQAKFAEAAPNEYAVYKKEERTAAVDGTRPRPSQSRKLDLNPDLSAFTVPPSSILLTDDTGVGVYLGIISIQAS
jgi:hypothetical protein